MIVCEHCGHAMPEPLPSQAPAPAPLDTYVRDGIPDTSDDLLQLFEATAPPSTLLLDKLREFVGSTPLDDGSGHAIEQGWQFALDTYREWAALDLRQPVVQDASLMTLVHVRNAMLANGAWEPERLVPSRIVFTMLRIYAQERLRQT